MKVSQTWLDRSLAAIAPGWQLKRLQARIASQLLQRHYEGAASSHRSQGWNKFSGDANAANATSLGKLRDQARDLVRNNRLMRSALRTIANHTVGWGIVPTVGHARAAKLIAAWAESTACDYDGRDNFFGLTKLVIRGTAEGGEMLVRRHVRRISDGLPIPLQLQVLEPDFLDTSKTMAGLAGGGYIIQGVEFDAAGRRVAYWLFPSHPGSAFHTSTMLGPSTRVPARDILHIFDRERAGQVRAVSWFAPLILPARDLDEFMDAQLMKQKIAACLAVILTDADGSGATLGTADDTADPQVDEIRPGGIINAPPGWEAETVSPPTVGDYDTHVAIENRMNAKGLGLSYEDYTGDYSNVNFSSARMARLEHYDNVHDWRWRLVIPQFCDPAAGWALEALQLLGIVGGTRPSVTWTAPPMPMIEPDKEGLAVQRNIRTGIQTLFEAIRERGYDPPAFLQEVAAGNRLLDELGIVLDSDPRKITQQGQAQAVPPKTTPGERPEDDAA